MIVTAVLCRAGSDGFVASGDIFEGPEPVYPLTSPCSIARVMARGGAAPAFVVDRVVFIWSICGAFKQYDEQNVDKV